VFDDVQDQRSDACVVSHFCLTELGIPIGKVIQKVSTKCGKRHSEVQIEYARSIPERYKLRASDWFSVAGIM